MKFRLRVYILISMLLILHVQESYAVKKKIAKIVLDAGHGGKDPGCHGAYSNEKDITLKVVLRVEKMLKEEYKNSVKVILTRNEDIYPPNNFATVTESLKYRTQVANQEKGDLFISVHVNSTPRKNSPVKGTLVLVCGPTRVEEKEGAIGENANNLVEQDDLLNPNDPATAIIIAQYSQAFLTKSIVIGEKINQEFAAQGRVTEGVRQQSLQVLASTAMPGVLVEVGYLNNVEEETYLNSEEGLNEIALAIFNGIKYYKSEMEKELPEVQIEN